MGLIRDDKGNNISVASVNGYTKENVIKAKRYLLEIGTNRRNFPLDKLVKMYNDVKGTNESGVGCRPCQATKYYNGLQNYAYFGELTLINMGKCTKDELDLALIDKASSEVKDDVSEVIEEDVKKESIKERMAKVRAQRKINKKNVKD